MKTVLPEVNQRVKDIIEHYAQGNVSGFIRMLKTDGIEEAINQQKVNRLFSLDPRTKKYPGVPNYIIDAIIQTFPGVTRKWLLVGEGVMISDKPGKPEPGDRMSAVRAFMLAFADDYASWRVEVEFPDADAEKIKKEKKKIKHRIADKANLILDGLDEWPLEE